MNKILLALLLVCGLAGAAEVVRVAQCEDGVCTMTEDMFRRVMESLEHWYAVAHTEKKCI